jgi:hypothetical protein
VRHDLSLLTPPPSEPGYMRKTIGYLSHIVRNPDEIAPLAELSKSSLPHADGPHPNPDASAHAQGEAAADSKAELSTASATADASKPRGSKKVLKDPEQIDIPAMLSRKFNFLKNPRHDTKRVALTDLLKVDVVTDDDGTPLPLTSARFKGEVIFRPIPTAVVFSDYEVTPPHLLAMPVSVLNPLPPPLGWEAVRGDGSIRKRRPQSPRAGGHPPRVAPIRRIAHPHPLPQRPHRAGHVRPMHRAPPPPSFSLESPV